MSAKAKKEEMETVEADDWFSDLDAELEKRKVEISEDFQEMRAKKTDVTKNLITDLWRICTRFNKSGIHFTLDPNYTTFARLDDFPYGNLVFNQTFPLDRINIIQLSDRTSDQGRIGDSIKVFYHTMDGKTNLKVIFEYCEGEHYYKYSGWKRLFAQHTLYDAPVERFDADAIHALLKDIVKAWFESHLKRSRDLLLKHIKQKYEKMETFTQ